MRCSPGRKPRSKRRRSRRAKNAPEKDPFVYDLDWDEDERLAEWQTALGRADDLPPVLKAIIALDAWNEIAVLQHAPWLGRLLSASVLREGGVTTSTHLADSGLKPAGIPINYRPPFRFEAGHYSNQLPAGSRL